MAAARRILLPILLAAARAASAADPGPDLPAPGASGIDAGVAVVVGDAPAEQLVRLAGGGRILVQCLVADRDREDALRRRVDALGWTGVVSVRQMRGSRLPYVDSMADLLLVRDAGMASAGEIGRVVAPYGVIGTAAGGAWTFARQPLPASMDEWPQTNHGPDQNAWSCDRLVSPFSGVRWMAPTPESMGGRGKPPILLVNGFFITHTYAGRGKSRLEARRAGNGALVWSMPSVAYEKEVQCDYMVANHRRLFTILDDGGPVVCLDLATGRRLFALADGPVLPSGVKPRPNDKIGVEGHNVVQCILAGDRLAVTYRGTVWIYEEATGKLLWTREFPQTIGLWATIAGDAIVLAEEPAGAFRGTGYMPGRGVRGLSCLALADGAQRWRIDDVVGPGDAILFVQPTAFRDRVVLNMRYTAFPGEAPTGGRETSRGYQMVAHDLGTGKRLWRNATRDRGGDLPDIFPYSGHYIDGDGVLWIGYISTATGIDVASGKVLKHHPFMVWNCHWARGVGPWYTAGQSFLDTATGGVSSSGSVRSACNNGSYFAYGATYMWSSGCPCGLFHLGKVALGGGPQPVPLAEAREPQIFQAAVAAGPDPADAWPGYMGGSWRSSHAAGAMPGQPAERWSVQLAPPLPAGPLAEDWRSDITLAAVTAPVALGDVVVAALPHAQRVVGIDAASGKMRWSTLLGGRIDAPPALARGHAYVGCRDGYVYCLALADGAVRWRNLIGVDDRQMVQASAFESVWPVGGGTLVHDGAVYAAAGRHSQFDGGIQVARMDPLTGAALWRSQVSSIRNYNNSVMNEPLAIRQGRLWMSRISLEFADGKVIDPRSPTVTFADGTRKTTRATDGKVKIPQIPTDDWPSTTGNNAGGGDFPGMYGQGYHMMRDRQAVVTRNGACNHFTFAEEGGWFAAVGRGGVGTKGGGPPGMSDISWYPPGAVPFGTKAAPAHTWSIKDAGAIAAIASTDDALAVASDRKGKLGLTIYGLQDGSQRGSTVPLADGRIVWRGMAVAGGAIYLSYQDGRLIACR